MDYIAIENRYAMEIYAKRECVIVRGVGAKVFDEAGREYIDCVAGHGVAGLGHSNPDVIEAITRQAQRLITCPGTFYNDTRALLLEKLVHIAPSSLKKVFLCNSGAESIEAAIKFARYSTKRTDFICAFKGFHGRTMGALSATFNPKYKDEFLPLVPGFHFVPYNNFEALNEVLETHPDIAGIILEPVQGEGGVNIGSFEYFRRVRELCTQRGIRLIIDEIQTGFCRTGKMFAIEHFGIEPDMMCVAKAIGGGLPMGAVLCSSEIRMEVGKHGTTFGGNPLVCAASLAAIEFMVREDLAAQSAEKGRYLLDGLKRIESKRIREVRGLGLMVGIELKEKVKPYIQALLQEGVLALPGGTTVLRLLPPMTIEYSELDVVIEKIGKCLG